VFYVLLVFVAAASIAAYLLFFLNQVPGAKEERFGALEALPEHLGRWKVDEISPEARAALEKGLRREVRVLYEPATGLFGGEVFIHQARCRRLTDNAIESVEPERRVKRRRVKP
jgi:hypothetical protein